MVTTAVLRGAKNGFNDFTGAASWLEACNLSNLMVLSEFLPSGLGLGREARIVEREERGSVGGGNLREWEGRDLENEVRWRLSGGRW